MPEIRYICISDLHLGAYNSLFTKTDSDGKVLPKDKSPVLSGFFKCLREMVKKVNQNHKAQLILNGDIFEMALANTNVAAMVFMGFMEELNLKENREYFSKNIIFIPGNHDHNLWETARERQYLEYILKLDPKKHMDPPWHHTRMIKPRTLKSKFIEVLMHKVRSEKPGRALIVYPNLALRNKEKNTMTIISHGHFTEAVYSLMSRLQNILFKTDYFPDTVDQMELENFAWIDFFWSVLGRSGRVGNNLSLLYDLIQDKKSMEKLISNCIQYTTKNMQIPNAFKGTIDSILNFFLTNLIIQSARRERGLSGEILSLSGREELYYYLNTIIYNQIRNENKGMFPESINFIFGHTHKPFQEVMGGFTSAGFPEKVSIYNTGAWVLDSAKIQEQVGGAVALIDDEKNVVQWRVYNENNFHPFIETLDPNSNLLAGKLSERINFTSELFIDFKNAIVEEIDNKRKFQEKLLSEKKII